MIKINLHDYKEEIIKIGIQKRVVSGVVRGCAIIIGALVIIGVFWVLLQAKADAVHGEITVLDKQVQSLAKDVKVIQKMQNKQKRVLQIMEGIQGLRDRQMPLTKILADLSMNIPDGIWLTDIEQNTLKDIIKSKVPIIFVGDPKVLKKKKKKKKGKIEPYEFIEIKGKAFGAYGDQSILDYLSYLRTIPYFEQVFIRESKYDLIGTYPVREFTIYCYMPAKKTKKA